MIDINSIILSVVTIGNNVINGAGIIVKKDLPNNAVITGVPAKVSKSFNEYKEQALMQAVYIT